MWMEDLPPSEPVVHRPFYWKNPTLLSKIMEVYYGYKWNMIEVYYGYIVMTLAFVTVSFVNKLITWQNVLKNPSLILQNTLPRQKEINVTGSLPNEPIPHVQLLHIELLQSNNDHSPRIPWPSTLLPQISQSLMTLPARALCHRPVTRDNLSPRALPSHSLSPMGQAVPKRDKASKADIWIINLALVTISGWNVNTLVVDHGLGRSLNRQHVTLWPEAGPIIYGFDVETGRRGDCCSKGMVTMNA